MECKFVVGQRLVCVDADAHNTKFDWSKRSDKPVVGAIYTVARIGPSPVPENNGRVVVWLREITHYCKRRGIEYWDCGYGTFRFRPVKTTSIEVFETILREASVGSRLLQNSEV